MVGVCTSLTTASVVVEEGRKGFLRTGADAGLESRTIVSPDLPHQADGTYISVSSVTNGSLSSSNESVVAAIKSCSNAAGISTAARSTLPPILPSASARLLALLLVPSMDLIRSYAASTSTILHRLAVLGVISSLFLTSDTSGGSARLEVVEDDCMALEGSARDPRVARGELVGVEAKEETEVSKADLRGRVPVTPVRVRMAALCSSARVDSVSVVSCVDEVEDRLNDPGEVMRADRRAEMADAAANVAAVGVRASSRVSWCELLSPMMLPRFHHDSFVPPLTLAFAV
jgi:hypothetical protein